MITVQAEVSFRADNAKALRILMAIADLEGR